MIVWMIDTGQKVKQFNNIHSTSEVTSLAQDNYGTKIYTGATDRSPVFDNVFHLIKSCVIMIGSYVRGYVRKLK
jgi:hypothetical protein